MDKTVNIRGTLYFIENATDILATMLAEALQSGMRDALSQAQAAYAIHAAFPSIPVELVDHHLKRTPDGSTEEVFTQNLDADEIAEISAVLMVAMLKARIERLKNIETTSESVQKRVQSGISSLESSIKQVEESLSGIQLEVLLSGVETKSGRKKDFGIESQQAVKILTPKKTQAIPLSKLAQLKAQVSQLEAQIQQES